MSTQISPLASVDPKATIGKNVVIGPFCLIGPDVTIGDDCQLDSHVTLVGHTKIGKGNRFWPNCVIGAEPQDKAYTGSSTRVEIGDHNQFREGVTVNRGADKEDGCTRIGNDNLLMSNAHVAHNCDISDNVILVNGVLLGGHVHVHDRAIISGNSVVHHFSTIGKLAFVSGGCRVPQDVPPFVLWAGSDDPGVRTLNIVGMKRAGISDETIAVIRRVVRLLYREHKSLATVRDLVNEELDGVLPIELLTLFSAIEATRKGRMGRAREVFRGEKPAKNAEAA